MLIPGHERWHPQPDFYYQPGGGPLFDMGPYYLTALVSLLGPVRRVTGSARASFPERMIRSEPRAGERIAVEVPTHLAAVLDFASGPIATLVTSFDVWASKVPKLEIYGSHGSLSLPDPNTFAGPVRIRGADDDTWRVVPVTRPYTKNSRGLGLADMAAGLHGGVLQAHRASGELAHHVLEVMHAVETASREGQHIAIASRCERPAPLDEGVGDGCRGVRKNDSPISGSAANYHRSPNTTSEASNHQLPSPTPPRAKRPGSKGAIASGARSVVISSATASPVAGASVTPSMAWPLATMRLRYPGSRPMTGRPSGVMAAARSRCASPALTPASAPASRGSPSRPSGR